MRTTALEFASPRRVTFTTTEVPSPSAGQALVRTVFSGISGGTELLAYRGELDPDLPRDEALGSLSGTFRYPFAYGYSCAGVVEESAGSLPVGTPVFGFHPHQHHFVAEERDLVRLPARADLRAATLYPLVETALQLSLDAGPLQHEVVPVLGLGAVGLLTALLLRRAGATVIASEPAPWRRELAEKVGIQAVPPQELADRVSGATDGRGAPVLVEVSGSPEALAAALPLLAHEGTALVGSWYGTKPVTLPLGADFHRRRLTIRSSQVSTIPARASDRWTMARRRTVTAELLTQLPLAALATTDYPFAAADRAFEAIDRGEAGLVHVALRYE